MNLIITDTLVQMSTEHRSWFSAVSKISGNLSKTIWLSSNSWHSNPLPPIPAFLYSEASQKNQFKSFPPFSWKCPCILWANYMNSVFGGKTVSSYYSKSLMTDSFICSGEHEYFQRGAINWMVYVLEKFWAESFLLLFSMPGCNSPISSNGMPLCSHF